MTVNTLFFEAVATAAGDTPIAYPNVSYETTDAYYSVHIMPTQSFAMGISNTNRQAGICQVSCFIRDGGGEAEALTMAKAIIDAFPRNTEFVGAGFKLRIDNPAWVSAGLQTGKGWYMIPVSIPYYTITQSLWNTRLEDIWDTPLEDVWDTPLGNSTQSLLTTPLADIWDTPLADIWDTPLDNS